MTLYPVDDLRENTYSCQFVLMLMLKRNSKNKNVLFDTWKIMIFGYEFNFKIFKSLTF